MSVDRSDEFILAALFLARCGPSNPPPQLGVYSWAAAYAAFYDALADGRSLRSFHNSLKATRDQFDSHVDSERRGWRDGDRPKPLPDRDASILQEWSARSCDELWQAVRPFADEQIGRVPDHVIRDLEAESDEEQEYVKVGREGKAKAVVSTVRERSPRLRAEALRLHGLSCQVCGFNFEEFYGGWGAGFAEVHHLKELGEAPPEGTETDVESDLAVVCSNCHRMIHRKAKRALAVDELREMVEANRANSDGVRSNLQLRVRGLEGGTESDR